MIIHIPAQSVRNDSRCFQFENNPVAYALKALGLRSVHVNWGSGIICYWIGNSGLVTPLEPQIKAWLWAWANYQPVDAISFDLFVSEDAKLLLGESKAA